VKFAANAPDNAQPVRREYNVCIIDEKTENIARSIIEGNRLCDLTFKLAQFRPQFLVLVAGNIAQHTRHSHPVLVYF